MSYSEALGIADQIKGSLHPSRLSSAGISGSRIGPCRERGDFSAGRGEGPAETSLKSFPAIEVAPVSLAGRPGPAGPKSPGHPRAQAGERSGGAGKDPAGPGRAAASARGEQHPRGWLDVLSPGSPS